MKHIVYITDENYAMPTCVSIQSLVENNISKTQYRITVLAFGLSIFSIQQLMGIQREYVTIHVREMEDDFSKLYMNSLIDKKDVHVSSAALCKFKIPDIFAELDDILYIDSDIIVNKDLSSVFDVNLTEYYLAAVDDMGDQYEKEKSLLASRLGISERRYFNSGFMYLNLKKMREDNATAKLIEYKRTGTNSFVDQDALNVILGEKRLSLSYKYNFRVPIIDSLDIKDVGKRYYGKVYESVEECLDEQVVLHMTDRMKPWVYNIPWFSDIFRNYYLKTAYRNQTLVLKSPLVPLIAASNKAWNELNERYIKLHQDYSRKMWRFPFDKILPERKIVLYGAGNVGRDFYEVLKKTGYGEVVLWVDKNYKKLGKQIVNPEAVCSCKYDYLLVALSREEDIKSAVKYLRDIRVEAEKIITI